MKKIDWLILLFILVASAFTLKDLYKPGFYTSHDGPHQIVRFYYYDQLLREGQFPPRWVGGLNYGFGYPLFIFSYHLPWVLAEVFRTMNFSIIDSVKLTFLAGFILSGFTMYLFLRSISRRLAAFSGTLLYLYAPYRFSNIFVRAAIGDATAFIFIPLIFLSAVQLARGKHVLRWIAVYALSLAGLLLSHAMVFFLVMLIFVPFIIISILGNRKFKLIYYHLSAVFLFAGLSAYYLLPSFFERSYTKFNSIMGSAFTGNTFVSLKNLLYSPWGYGMMKAVEGGMSLQIGLAQWFAALLVIVSLAFKKSRLSLFFLAAFAISVFMMLKDSLFIWKLLQQLAVIDFTWRILIVSVFSAAVLGALAVNQFRNKIIAIMTAITLIVLAFYANRNHWRINQSLPWDMPFFLSLEKTTNSFNEYTPKWVREEIIREKAPPWEFDGDLEARILEDKNSKWEAEMETDKAGTLRLNKIYYPGWQMTVNGKPVVINYTDRGLMETTLPGGKSRVAVSFKETPLRRISDSLTMFSIIITGVLLFRRKINA